MLAQADLYYPAESLSFDGESQLVGLDGSGAWERVAVPSLRKVLASAADFGAHDYAQTMSPTGTYFAFTNGGPPLNVWNTLTAPTPDNGQLGAWEVGNTPSALAISADGRMAADADSGKIYVSDITSYHDASSSSLRSLSGDTTVNPGALTFVGQSDSELVSASGSLLTVWNLSQDSRIPPWRKSVYPVGVMRAGGPVSFRVPTGATRSSRWATGVRRAWWNFRPRPCR